MSSLPYIAATGNLTRPPEIRYTGGGKAVVNLSIAVSNGRRDDPKTKTTFLDCTAWDAMAENIGNNLTQGQRVNIVGHLEQRSYETKEGEKRTVFEVALESIGPDLRFAQDGQRSSSSGGQSAGEDPWGSAPAGNPSQAPF